MAITAIRKGNEEQASIREFKDLPPAFSVDLFAATFGISRKLAFQVVKDEGLAIRLGGKRLICLRDRVINWLNNSCSSA